MRKLTLLLIMAFVLAACSTQRAAYNGPYGTTYDTFTQYDVNQNDRIEMTEFRRGYDNDGLYDAWDQDRDGIIDDNEFGTMTFDAWDTNADGRLDANEFRRINDTWYRDTDYGRYNTWDQNRDGRLDANEFNSRLNDTGFFDDWDRDRDGMLNDDEFRTGVYNTWDIDNDGMLDSNEFDTGYNGFGFDY